MIKILKWFVIFQIFSLISCFRNQFYSKEDILRKREEVRKIFQHAYDGYLTHASGYDELRPLTCDGINTWGSYSLTLIDALDTLAVMGNYTEFRRVVRYLEENSNFDSDINVSVFETNIRIVGGLLSAHLMLRRAGVDLEPGWPCNGPLLRMAEDVARRLLPAFDTKTGMPYGTVNLRYGVPSGETPVTCTAGVGTFLVEFGTLSRLTGDPIYEEVALNAIYSLWKYRSPIGLFGNHIDVQTGRWTAQDSGIGAGVDSYFEYLVKGSVLLNRPDLLEMFHESRQAIDKYMRKEDWYVWVSMTKAQITLPVFQSLEAFWPGILSAVGDIEAATKTFAKYHSVWKQYGFLPEFYNIPNLEATANRESYPLRPEIIESAMFLYRVTKDQYYLEFGDDMLTSIQHSARTECGYATIKNVRTHERENRMESFFLAETTKYLYLLFDPDNFIHNDGAEGIVFETSNGECVLEAGNYIFNTEAHPIDPSALRCCHGGGMTDIFEDFNIDDYKGEVLDMNSRKFLLNEREEKNKKLECPKIIPRNANITVDIEIVTEGDGNFLDTEKLLSKLKEEQEKKNMANNKSEDYIGIKAEQNWESSDLKEIDVEQVAHYMKLILETLDLECKIFESDLIFNLIRQLNNKANDSKINAYELFILTEKTKVLQNLVLGIETYHNELSKDDSNISLSNIISIAREIFEAIKKNDTIFEFEKKVHHANLLNIFKNTQLKYENTIENHPETYNFLIQYLHKPKTAKDSTTLQLIKYLEIVFSTFLNRTENKNAQSIVLNYEIFEYFIKLVEKDNELFNQDSEINRLVKKFQKFEFIISENNEDGNSESSLNFSKTQGEDINKKENDDIILVRKYDKTQQEELEKGIGTIVPVTIVEDFSHLENSDDDLISNGRQENVESDTSKEKINEEIKKKIDDSDLRLQSPVLKPFGTETSTDNPSILSGFIQTFLKSSISENPEFDPQVLLEKIRASGDYMNYVPKWELFSCKAQSFLQKLYVHGIF